MVELRINAIRPGEAAALEIWNDEAPLAHIVLEAPDITDLIRSLAELRASMSDAVPMEVDPGTKLIAQLNPRWEMPKRHPEGHRALVLRHPGLGWLSFAFPIDQAELISAQFLNKDALTLPLEAVPKKNPFVKTFTIEITKHAAATLSERGIEQDWLHRALFSPDAREEDPTDAELIRLYKRIPERDDRVLRAVVKPLPSGFKVITAFFDRGRK